VNGVATLRLGRISSSRPRLLPHATEITFFNNQANRAQTINGSLTAVDAWQCSSSLPKRITWYAESALLLDFVVSSMTTQVKCNDLKSICACRASNVLNHAQAESLRVPCGGGVVKTVTKPGGPCSRAANKYCARVSAYRIILSDDSFFIYLFLFIYFHFPSADTAIVSLIIKINPNEPPFHLGMCTRYKKTVNTPAFPFLPPHREKCPVRILAIFPSLPQKKKSRGP